ncbi:MAG TPA: adenylate/guanylate cyclase domain-containing protein [Chitinophagaceae bacterium]|nr:adenylate/guanylate cyclase domain-containing protein [Chitinophagaceae bacterium]
MLSLLQSKYKKNVHVLNEYQLRIGIHIGEVIFRDNDVLGDGVNIASRIQSITDPGAIFISEAVYQNVSNKKQIKTSYNKEVQLKNVIGPVKIYKVLIDPNNNDNLIKANKSLSRNALLFFLLFTAIAVFFMQIISSVQEEKYNMKSSSIISARAFLDVYPNPVSTILTISIGVKSITIQRPVIKILDLNGVVMYSSEFAPIQQAFLNTIDVSRLKNAEYIVQLFDGSKYLEKISFLKK